MSLIASAAATSQRTGRSFRFADLNVSTRIASGFLGVLFILIAGSIFSIRTLQALQESGAALKSAAVVQDRVNDVDQTLLKLRMYVREFAAGQDTEAAKNAREALPHVLQAIAATKQATSDDGERARLSDLEGLIVAYGNNFEKLMTAVGEQKALLKDKVNPLGSSLQSDLQKLAALSLADNDVAGLEKLSVASEMLAGLRVGYSQAITDNYFDHHEELIKKMDELKKFVGQIEMTSDRPGQAEVIEHWRKSLFGYRVGMNEIVDRAAENNKLVSAMRDMALQASKVANAIEAQAGQMSADLDARNIATFRSSHQMLWSLSAGGVFCAMLLAWFVGRSVAGPVKSVTAVMSRLATGDTNITIPAQDAHDEIGAMARAVVVFRDAAIEKTRLEAMTREETARAEAERAARDAQKAEEARHLQDAVTRLGEGLRKLADGDLTHKIEVAFVGELEALRADFNASVETLRGTVQGVLVSTEAIRSGSQDMASAADDMARRTEQQAASLEQTSAALEQITSTVNKTAEGAHHAQAVVTNAKGEADASGVIVNQTIDAMQGISGSAKKITQIIGVIDEIAFQTNLLALNAGVEAARAGEAGRGFAVVASEVRALAQRSAEAAKEIKSLINDSTRQVDTGVELVGKAATALKRIVAQVDDISNVVVEIASGTREQAQSLQEVSSAITQMDQATQQNAAMVEQSTAATHSLSKEVHVLSGMVTQFRAGNTPAAAPARRPVVASAPAGAPRPAPAKPMARPVAKLAAVRAPARSASVPALRSSGSAQRKPQAEEHDWAEF
jgi:methyl-accepting chemotaxis protein